MGKSYEMIERILQIAHFDTESAIMLLKVLIVQFWIVFSVANALNAWVPKFEISKFYGKGAFLSKLIFYFQKIFGNKFVFPFVYLSLSPYDLPLPK